MTLPTPPSPSPAPQHCGARVFKQVFTGSLGERTLYIYLPPDYFEPHAAETHYPILYLHDGQNCFEAFSGDAFSGSWRADETAERLILEGQLQPCILVGVSNGGAARLAEYLPPYSRFATAPSRRPRNRLRRRRRVAYLWGQAHRTFAFYKEVHAYMCAHFRVKGGREHVATCGSSMGGLFSAYIAFEHPAFARQHAILSASFWVTETATGELEMLTRLRQGPVHDLRVWLDSGEGEGDSDDNKGVTLEARQALLDAGYTEGKAFVYHLAEGAGHSEAAWAARLPQVLSYLFPPAPAPCDAAETAAKRGADTEALFVGDAP
jgi:predicted alpha/beta superfamily hydrolase